MTYTEVPSYEPLEHSKGEPKMYKRNGWGNEDYVLAEKEKIEMIKQDGWGNENVVNEDYVLAYKVVLAMQTKALEIGLMVYHLQRLNITAECSNKDLADYLTTLCGYMKREVNNLQDSIKSYLSEQP